MDSSSAQAEVPAPCSGSWHVATMLCAFVCKQGNFVPELKSCKNGDLQILEPAFKYAEHDSFCKCKSKHSVCKCFCPDRAYYPKDSFLSLFWKHCLSGSML